MENRRGNERRIIFFQDPELQDILRSTREMSLERSREDNEGGTTTINWRRGPPNIRQPMNAAPVVSAAAAGSVTAIPVTSERIPSYSFCVPIQSSWRPKEEEEDNGDDDDEEDNGDAVDGLVDENKEDDGDDVGDKEEDNHDAVVEADNRAEEEEEEEENASPFNRSDNNNNTYYFVYWNENRMLKSLCLLRFQCPLCDNNNDGNDLEQRYNHCVAHHGKDYTFKPIQSTDGMFHLIVEKKVTSTLGTATSSRQVEAMNDESMDVSSHGSRTSDSPPPSYADALVTNVSVQKQQYYLYPSFDEISNALWYCGHTEVTYNEEWRHRADDCSLYDLKDLTDEEKHFFHLWNDFMRKNPILRERQLH